ncbi:growth arrest and DNA damage-inducible protein GADD45 beta-like [Syngnathus typhle]|uniref:growth arrest and DNA damage-inducible protein GADD45 beta-like n=1 Tax=Syngnathus typhle TaxID=161592 RepID=UPI002A6B4177|nr:growth arrest and DNA damage-inducible protein GADD45 beta-like [Syngnathus typhle]
MTPESTLTSSVTENRMQSIGVALEELLVAAQKQECLTVGIYESAQLLNADPDSVVLCVLAADGDEADVALQIHFTLLQAFCRDSAITILRVSGLPRLRQLLANADDDNQRQDGDIHCMLVTNPHADHCHLREVGIYCQESADQWIPELVLQEH